MLLSEDALAWVTLARAPALDAPTLAAALERLGPAGALVAAPDASSRARRNSGRRRVNFCASGGRAQRRRAKLARASAPSLAAVHRSAIIRALLRSLADRPDRTVCRGQRRRASRSAARRGRQPQPHCPGSRYRLRVRAVPGRTRAWQSPAGSPKASTPPRIAAHWRRRESRSRCSAAASIVVYPRGNSALGEAIEQQRCAGERISAGNRPAARAISRGAIGSSRRLSLGHSGGRGGAQERLADHRPRAPTSAAERCSRSRARSTIP